METVQFKYHLYIARADATASLRNDPLRRSVCRSLFDYEMFHLWYSKYSYRHQKQNSHCNIDMFLITKRDTVPNTSHGTLVARYMTPINYTAGFIQPEASAYAHSCEIA